jgi:hypothetical protein
MENKDNTILAECPLFVCRECHTKTGHTHQKWCTLQKDSITECERCHYWQKAYRRCGHPYRKKDGNTI